MRGVAGNGYANGRARRAEIIERATVLFGEAGYYGASLREIAARCGMSQPGLLHHFASKETLLAAVLEHRDEVDGGMIDPGSSGLDVLRAYVTLIDRNARRRRLVELSAVLSAEATAPEHPAHGFFVRRYRRVVEQTTAAFLRAQQEGVLRPGIEPEEAGRRLVALMDGLQVQWLMDERTDMTAAVRGHLQDLLTVPLPAS